MDSPNQMPPLHSTRPSVTFIKSAMSLNNIRQRYNKTNMVPGQLKLLIWKNFLLQRRHKWQTFFEIMSPVIFSSILIVVRCLIEPESKNGIEYTPFAPITFDPMIFDLSSNSAMKMKPRNLTLAFSPDTDLTRAVAVGTVQRIANERVSSIAKKPMSVPAEFLPAPIAFKDSETMGRELLKKGVMDNVLAGIQFPDSMAGAKQWPKHIEFSLRFPASMRTPMVAHPLMASWRTNLLYEVFPRPEPRAANDSRGGKMPGYSGEMFLALQHTVSLELMKAVAPSAGQQVDSVKVYLQRFPQTPYKKDRLLLALEQFISMIIMLSFAYTAVSTVKVVATEKELQLKETMRIMGVHSWLHWCAWFIKQYSFLIISSTIIVILIKVPWQTTSSGERVAVFNYTPATFLLFLLLLYTMATISFCFMVSVFFAKANTAASFMGLAWFATYAPYMFVQSISQEVPTWLKMMTAIFPNSAMGYAFEMCVICEGERGLQWKDVLKPISYRDTFAPFHLILMLLLNTVLYFLITIYIEKINPGAYGVPLPWHFPISKIFWANNCKRVADTTERNKEEFLERMHDVVHEEEPQGRTAGVCIKNLTKSYHKGSKKAVDNLNLNLYQDDITILLGHNGAGKTTTISMLTGMITPTSGSAKINGIDIVKDTAAARMSLGLCPQHDVLFPDLTVAEHILFYAKLKGVPDNKIKQEIDRFVRLLNLEDKRNTLSSRLSGGQKRRVSVAAAMCGASKIVLLDEPTSGLDPASRRALWDLLLEEKKGRTIILSTHFMDEADILGDRIAIMSDGKLQCVGTPYFLKHYYGSGYKLIIAKTDNCNPDLIMDLISKHVPEAKQLTNIGSELSYMLPKEAVSRFSGLLKELEVLGSSLGVTSYGLTITTIEDVFMKAGAETFVERQPSQYTARSLSIPEDNTAIPQLDVGPIEKVTGFQLKMNHIKAMFLKHGYSTMRQGLQNLIQLSMPIVQIMFSVMIVRSWKFIKELPALALNLWSGFKHTRTLVSNVPGINEFYTKVMKSYTDLFRTHEHRAALYDVGVEDMGHRYKSMFTANPELAREELLIGATFSADNVTAWFSNYGLHDSAISLSLANNAIMQTISPGTTLTVYNEPLPFMFWDEIAMMASGSGIGWQLAFNLGFCMTFVTAFFVLFNIKERVSGSKLLQRASGVTPLVMWGCAYIWDWLWFCVIAVLIVFTLAAFQEQTYSTPPELGRLMLALVVFGFGTLPVHYLLSFLFDNPATGFSQICFINIFLGLMPFLIQEILRMPIIMEDSPNAAHYFDRTFIMIPHYSLCRALKELSIASFALSVCDKMCDQFIAGDNCNRFKMCKEQHITLCCINDHPYFQWDEPGVGRYVISTIIVGVLAFILLMLFEYQVFSKLLYMVQRRQPSPAALEEDSDIEIEREMVNNMHRSKMQNYSIVSKNLTKHYKKFLAVRNLSFDRTVRNGFKTDLFAVEVRAKELPAMALYSLFENLGLSRSTLSSYMKRASKVSLEAYYRIWIAVSKGECFGLLGVNGAGKTTTFKMLTGDERISSGDAYVHGLSIKTNLREVHQIIGYCPQFDALLENLTGRETCKIYCLLRGIPVNIGTVIAEDLAHQLSFMKHFDKKVLEYSGGNKRKLSTAVALLGDAPLVFLDEPTTGMDPASKRRMWSALAETVRLGRSAVLTTHSMEECEALCTRLTIMAGGRMHCLGSLQHLKSKFSSGYTLVVKCASGPQRDATLAEVHDYIIDKIPDTKLIESYQGVSTLDVPQHVKWWEVFEMMEEANKQFPIEDYSVTQTSLEQLFMRFSKQYSTGAVW